MKPIASYTSVKLEKERTKLHKLVEKYGFMDDRVIRQSQKLDRVLNYYQHPKVRL